jgi:uncharacterized protein (TIGR03435 family)
MIDRIVRRRNFGKRVALASAGIMALAAPVLFASACAPPIRAQSTAVARPEFEVTSVKQRPLDAAGGAGTRGTGRGCPESFRVDRGRVDIECATLTTLITYAFHFPPSRITGPDWMMSLGQARFDIAAKLPQGASESQVPEMLQALLADRFKLALHRGNAEHAIYALVVAKGGLKVKEAAPESGAPTPATSVDTDAPPGKIELLGGVETRMAVIPNADGSYTTAMTNPHVGTVRETEGPQLVQRWDAPNITFQGLAELLDRVTPLESPVVDRTGLKGRYQLVLEVSMKDLLGARPPEPNAGGDPNARENARMDMEEAVLKGFNDGLRKLGLQLERRKGPVETLVVDHAEKTPTGN